MAALIEQQDDCFGWAWLRVDGAERRQALLRIRVVDGIATGAGARIGALVAQCILNVSTINDPDGVAQFADQLEGGECLFWRPGARDVDGQLTQMGRRRVGWRGHALLPRRLAARFSVCSCASLRR